MKKEADAKPVGSTSPQKAGGRLRWSFCVAADNDYGGRFIPSDNAYLHLDVIISYH